MWQKLQYLKQPMPTLVTSSIIAEQFRLNTKLTNLIIGFSIIVGFFYLRILVSDHGKNCFFSHS